jgi:hypothetical protein
MRLLVRYSLAAAGVLAIAAAPALRAQGSLSTQGFGYPGGQLSTRALGAGGSLADFDPNSPLNPASLSLGLRAAVYAQYDPEFRSVTSPSGSASSTTARFPVVGVSGRFGRATVGLSFSNLLDRSWNNTYVDTQTVGGQVVQSQVTAQSTGGISDARAALSYQVSEKLYLGVGVHVFPGENRTVLGRSFADSLQLGSFSQASTFNFSGSAVSVGFLATPVAHLNLAASARFGGSIHMHAGDSTVVGSATIPNRWSVSAAYEGFAGSALAVRYGREKWTSMAGLGSPGLVIRDAAELAGGMEVAGPKVSGIPMAVRLGFRSRDLPFAVGTETVAEQSLTAGVGIPLAAGRGAADIALARAHRTSAGLAETGWILSIGFAIKP